MDQRIGRLQKSITGTALIENPVDLLYLTGLSLSRGRLWVGEETYLAVDGRYLAAAQKALSIPVKPLEEKRSVPKKVLFDSALTSYDAVLGLKKEFPDVEWVPQSRLLKHLRAVKDPKETEALRRAARLTLSGIEHVKHLLTEGVTEKELAFQFEFFCRKQGASGLSFDPIIAFGEKSAYPHYRAGSRKLEQNQVVLIDVGAIFDGYRGDLTRAVFFGTPDPKLFHFQELVQAAFRAAFRAARPGVEAKALDVAAKNVFEAAGVEKLFIHSLGHGVGLETHEYPALRLDSKDLLEEGMIFTIEPGLYQPGLGGIRFEEMVLLTANGAKILHA